MLNGGNLVYPDSTNPMISVVIVYITVQRVNPGSTWR